MGGGDDAGTHTAQSSQTPEQEKVMAKLLNYYDGRIGESKPAYQGLRVAPLSDTQKTILSSMSDYGKTGVPMAKETGQTIRDALTGQAGAQKLGSDDIDKYFTHAYRDPAMYSLRNEVNPAIDEAFAGPGFFGSARSNARAGAAQNTARRLNESRAGLEWDVFNRNQALDEAKAGRAMAAIGPAMQYGRQPIDIAGDLYKFGSIEQTQHQKELDADFQKFLDENQITDPETLSVLTNLLGMNAQSYSKTSPNVWKAEQWGGLGSKALGGYLLGMMG